MAQRRRVTNPAARWAGISACLPGRCLRYGGAISRHDLFSVQTQLSGRLVAGTNGGGGVGTRRVIVGYADSTNRRSWSVFGMALSELAAVEAAYQVLHPLDAAGRRRALQWLSDALGAEGALPESAPGTATSAGRAGADRAPQRAPATKSASTRAPRRRASTEATAVETPAGRPRRGRAARQAAAPVARRERG